MAARIAEFHARGPVNIVGGAALHAGHIRKRSREAVSGREPRAIRTAEFIASPASSL
jgi:hypothetical protein